ncbi:MAG: flavin reductase family protein [Acidobacteriota bacterium]
MIYPLPAVMVSCGDIEGEHNIITVAWTGILSTDPARCYISVRPERYSYNMIKNSGEFVINLTTSKLAFATDWCGVRSGRDYNKFTEMGLTPLKSLDVRSPMIGESPVNLECRVIEIKKMGSHDMFIADILQIHATEAYINKETGAFDLGKANLISYSHGKYYTQGRRIGKFGFSVRKKKRKKRGKV